MQYCYMDKDDRLVAVIDRIGNGTQKSPVRWHLRWALGQWWRKDLITASRLEAVAAIKDACPHATLKVFDRRRGEWVR